MHGTCSGRNHACVSGTVDFEGMDTTLSECLVPDSTQYTRNSCVLGFPMSPGSNTVILNCTKPLSGVQYVDVSCVPGTEFAIGVDTTIEMCSQPVRVLLKCSTSSSPTQKKHLPQNR